MPFGNDWLCRVCREDVRLRLKALEYCSHEGKKECIDHCAHDSRPCHTGNMAEVFSVSVGFKSRNRLLRTLYYMACTT